MLICERCGKTYKGVEPLRCFCQPKKEGIVQEIREYTQNIVNTPELWKQLHTMTNSLAVYSEWKRRLPCGPCKVEWQRIQEAIPPDFSSSELFFEWTVKGHNEINKKLGKPILSLEEAKNIWK